MFVTGSRGEWGYIRPILKRCVDVGVDYSICATNMHLLPRHGNTVDEIVADGFAVDDRIYMAVDGVDRIAHAKSLGVFAQSFADVLARVRPDWVLLAGDRGEQLMAAVVAGYARVPVAHVQAGERSGTIDGVARHAIGKFAHLHFAANDDAADRLLRLGENEWRIRTVGAPQLDELRDASLASDVATRLSVDISRGYLIVIQHPATEEIDRAGEQAAELLAALARYELQKLWVMPNNDAGADCVRRTVRDGRAADTHVFDNLRREDFLGLMRGARAMVGNSSSGLLEAPSFGVPAVNIGCRQVGRVRGANVVDVRCWDVNDICAGINVALSDTFRASLVGMRNPYGDGRSAEKIVDALESVARDSWLLNKRLTY